MKEKVYWLDSLKIPTFTDRPPEKNAVLIVGGGYTGLTAAIRLKQAGLDVTVLDSRPMGSGASARNGGLVLPGLSEDPAVLIKKFGRVMARRLFAESVESVNLVERLIREAKIDCHFKRHGHLLAAFKPGHYESLKKSRDLMQSEFNHSTTLVPGEELAGEIDSACYKGALLDPAGAGLHPAEYVAGLIDYAAGLGVGLHENITALRIDKRNNGFTVITDRGPLTAEKIIIATNGYTGPLTPWLQRRIVPVRSLMIATEPLPPDLIRELIPNGRVVSDTKIFLYYFRISPDGQRILFGGRPKSPRLSLRENGLFMRQNMLTVFPRLESLATDYVWWGKLGFHLNHLPHIGTRRDLCYALGYAGHGVALATYLGEKLAGLVMEKETDTAFTEPKFRAVPMYYGRPWFLPLVYRYFSLKDRLF